MIVSIPCIRRIALTAIIILLYYPLNVFAGKEVNRPDIIDETGGTGYLDKLLEICRSRALAPVEGIWEIPGGSVISIIDNGGERLEVCNVSSVHPRLRCGQAIGHAVCEDATGSRYTLTMYTDVDANGKPCGPHEFTLSAVSGESGQLTFRPKKKIKGDVWLLYRLLLTVRLRDNNTATDLRAVRIYPSVPSQLSKPVVL